MIKNIISNKKHLLVIVIIPIIVIFLSLIVFGSNQSRKRRITKELISKIDFACPTGAVDKIEQWGISGYTRYCADNAILNGMWTAWENQIVAVKGTYENGKRDGEWVWYNRHGEIYKISEFKNGKQMSETIHGEYNWK